MFYEYALEPTALSSWGVARYFLDAFGPWKGRFISAYPRHWKRLVYQNLNCPDVEKKQIEERLARLDRRVFVSRGSPYDGNRSWLENAIEENTRKPFRAVIANKLDSTSGNILDARALDETNELWNVYQGSFVQRDPDAIAEALSLLLQVSSRVVVIDPYFRPYHTAKIQVLKRLCALLTGSASIEVHARLGDDTDPKYEQFAQGCTSRLPRIIADKCEATIFCWKQKNGGQRLHNRYIITDIAGVQLGDSLEGGAPGEHDRLSILDERSRCALWEQFVDPRNSFEEIGQPIRVLGHCSRK